MRKLIQLILLAAVVASTFSGPLTAARLLAASAPAAQAPTTVTVSLTSDPVEVITTSRPEGTFTSFRSATPLGGDSGFPALPMVSQTVGLPSRTAPAVSYALGASESLGTAGATLEPVATYDPVYAIDDAAVPSHLAARYVVNEAAYRTDGWYPAAPVQVSEVDTLRGLPVAVVSFYPVQVNLATGELRYTPSVDVTLSWADSDVTASPETLADPNFDDVYRNVVGNYEDAQNWALPRISEATRGPDVENRWIIRVEGQGLFKLPLSQLQSAGVDVSNQARLALFYKWGPDQVQQAMYFDNNTLYFVNTRDNGFWSREITFNLTVLPTPTALRMATAPGTPDAATTVNQVAYTQRFEEERQYLGGETQTEPGERWLWRQLVSIPNAPAFYTDTYTVTFGLTGLVPNTSAQVFTELGPNERRQVACYKAQVEVNDNMTERQWSGLVPFGQVLALPAGELQASNNQFIVRGIHCPGNVSGNSGTLGFNAFDVEYQRYLSAQNNALMFDGIGTRQNYQISGFSSNDIVAFEVSTLNTPTFLTGGQVSGAFVYRFAPASGDVTDRFLVSTKTAAAAINSITRYVDRGTRTDVSQTDYIIIAPPAFAAAAEPLAQFRESYNGFSTRIVLTDDIYNDFGDGSPDPETIRAFLKYAYQTWQGTRPAYVILIGDGTYDPLNYLNTGAVNWVSPLFRYADIYWGDVPADGAFVMGLDAGDPDNSPYADMKIGRLAVNSVAEATSTINKIINYEGNTPSGDWRTNFTFVADDYPDDAGNFFAFSDQAAELVSENVTINKEYMSFTPYDPDGNGPLPPYPLKDNIQVRDGIVSRVNSGTLILQYIGHGAPSQWAGNGNVWRLSRGDLNLLTNSSRQPFNLAWTCWEGYFVHPEASNASVAETMVRAEGRGSIGAFAPVGLDVAFGHDLMTQAWFTAMFPPTGAPTLETGSLTNIARSAAITGNYSRLAFSYILHGDPALKLAVDPCVYDEGTSCSTGGVLYLPQTVVGFGQ